MAIGTALSVSIAALSACIGQGKAAASAFESIARQPSASGDIRSNLIISLALIESIVIYALLVFFLLQGKLPTLETITGA
ncbi:MAG: ATP synthase F0 subunit C [Armatimonadia bacterium]|nr:ATP synthase F0 subunit C [Armatimonadia bacterium]